MRSKHTRSMILAQSAAVLTVVLLSASAFAMNRDMIGGPGNNTQTVSHCGVIQLDHIIFTEKPRNVTILQRKLTKMGYYRGAIDGNYGKLTKQSVIKLQQDYGLQPDGVIGQETAEAIVYLGHPLRNVRACKRSIEQASL
jgi:murein L,D-transpeptidase YcbB/YkuD